MSWDRRPFAEYRRLQDKLVRATVRDQLARYSPFYKDFFKRHRVDPERIRTTDDLVRIPFISKEDVAPTSDDPGRPRRFILQPTEEEIRAHYPKTRLAALLLRQWTGGPSLKRALEWEYKPIHLHFTTGRSARPTAFGYTGRDLVRLADSGERLFEVFGADRAWTLVNAFPFAPHLAFWLTYYATVRLGMTSLHTGGGRAMGTKKIVDALESLRAQTLISMPGYAYHLLRQARSEGRNLSNVKLVVFGGERLPQGLRQKVGDLLTGMGADEPKVMATYALTEARVAWGECETGGACGYHTYPDFEFLEIVDPKTGERVNDGEPGEIVYTALDWRGSCVLRYRTGDLAKGGITHERCPHCGRTVPRISADIQRVHDVREFQLSKVKGTLINLNNFFPLMMGHPGVEEWQVVISKRNDDPLDVDEVRVYVAPRKGEDFLRLRTALEKEIHAEMEFRPNEIVPLPIDELVKRLGMEEQTKELRILDTRPG